MQGKDDEAAGAGAIKAVVDADAQADQRRQQPEAGAAGDVEVVGHILLGQEGGGHAEGQQADEDLAQDGVVEQQGYLRADGRAQQGRDHAHEGHAPLDEVAAGKGAHGGGRTQRGADLVAGKGVVGGHVGQQQRGQGDKAAAARYGVDEAGHEGRPAADEDDAQRDHGPPTIP